jgi:hypothetical protein
VLPTLGWPLVIEVFRTRLAGCAVTVAVLCLPVSVLVATETVLPVVNLESAVVLTIFFLAIAGDAVGPVRRLLGLIEPTTLPSLFSGERKRPPNFASFSD